MYYAKKKAAFFDIDGTLINGFIICDFPEYLVKKGFFDPEAHKNIQTLLLEYKNGEIEPTVASHEIPIEYALGLKGQNKEKIGVLAARFMSEYKNNVFQYSKQLVNLMNKNGFMTIGMSGSPIEVIEELDFLGFKKLYGSEMSTTSGTYDGNIKTNLVILENKKKLFQSLIRIYNIDLKSSFGFGDTEYDLPVLTNVFYPIAVNPNKKLRIIAEQKNWLIGDNKSVFQTLKAFRRPI